MTKSQTAVTGERIPARVYFKGGFFLPAKLEFRDVASYRYVTVVDAHGRFVRNFNSANMARAYVRKINNQK